MWITTGRSYSCPGRMTCCVVCSSLMCILEFGDRQSSASQVTNTPPSPLSIYSNCRNRVVASGRREEETVPRRSRASSSEEMAGPSRRRYSRRRVSTLSVPCVFRCEYSYPLLSLFSHECRVSSHFPLFILLLLFLFHNILQDSSEVIVQRF